MPPPPPKGSAPGPPKASAPKPPGMGGKKHGSTDSGTMYDKTAAITGALGGAAKKQLKSFGKKVKKDVKSFGSSSSSSSSNISVSSPSKPPALFSQTAPLSPYQKPPSPRRPSAAAWGPNSYAKENTGPSWVSVNRNGSVISGPPPVPKSTTSWSSKSKSSASAGPPVPPPVPPDAVKTKPKTVKKWGVNKTPSSSTTTTKGSHHRPKSGSAPPPKQLKSVFSTNTTKSTKSTAGSTKKSTPSWTKPKTGSSTGSSTASALGYGGKTKKGGVANRLAMFEDMEEKAGNVAPSKKSNNTKKGGKTKSKSSKIWSKSKGPSKPPSVPRQHSDERNLKPSLVGKTKMKAPSSPPQPPSVAPASPAKKAPPKPPKSPSPRKGKSASVDWQKRKVDSNIFKMNDRQKSSPPGSSPKPPPKKKMNFFKKSHTPGGDDEPGAVSKTPGPPPVPPFQGLHKGHKSQSMEMPRKAPAFTTTGSASSGLPPPVPQRDEEEEEYVVEEINTKISRPSDYNEISYVAADPIAMRRKKKGLGGRSALARAQITKNEPTSYKSAMVMNAPPPVPTSAPRTTPKRMSAPSPVFQRKKSPTAQAPKKPPALPSAPPPMPKKKDKISGPMGPPDQFGKLQAMPTKQQDGWIYSQSGMVKVSYKGNFQQIQNNNIFEGMPVRYQLEENMATNIRLNCNLDPKMVKKECMNKKKKTLVDAAYYVVNTPFEFNGNIAGSHFDLPKDCSPQKLAAVSENVINAFLNTNGGTFYIGIDKSWNIKGIPTEQLDIESTRNAIDVLVKKFQPKLKPADLNKIKVSTVALVEKDGTLREDLVVMTVLIPGPIKGPNGSAVTFKNTKGDKFKKNLNYIMKVVM